MIAPRRTRLVEVADLRGFQRAIASLSLGPDAWTARETVVLVPSRAAAEILRRTIEDQHLASVPALVLPHLLTRDEWYAAMLEGLDDPPPRLSPLEREVLAGRAAREAAAQGCAPPFRLRPALLAEIVTFYDMLHASRRSVDAFERLVVDDLEPRAEADRGAERLLRQTRFLVALFRRYDAALSASGAVDEAALRRLLLARGASPFRRVVVTVGDRAADARGLWPADFDLLTRLDRLEEVDVVATGRALAAGFRERLLDAMPGIEHESWSNGTGAGRPALVAPADAPGRLYWTSRDREEELIDVARWMKWERAGGEALENPSDRVAVVFRRPLPYVYLAQTVFEAAGLAYQASDALPLASEPYAAAVDLVFAFVTSRFALAETVALLASPHFAFGPAPGTPGPLALDDIGRLLAEAGIEGGGEWARLAAERLPPAASRRRPEPPHLQRVLEAAAAAAAELEPLTRRRSASGQFDLLLSFLAAHQRPPRAETMTVEALAARAAVVGALSALRAAHARWDDAPSTAWDLAPRVRRWMEAQTFAPRRGRGGLQVVDAAAARYGDFDEAWLVGVVEGEWPERGAANVFYPAFLLAQLGWPRQRDRDASARAAFEDLVHLPARRTRVSVFTLEEDAIVEPSALLEELDLAGMEVIRAERPPRLRVLPEEALATDPPRFDVLGPAAASWATTRRDRGRAGESRRAGPAGRPFYAVTALEEYLECPFRYFARHVLRLREEPDDDLALAPRLQGQVLHQVLHDFYDDWQRSGRGAITVASLPEARQRFREAASAALDRLAPRDAARLRGTLLGSAFAPGAGEIAARAEIERGIPVVARLLEYRLDGVYRLERGAGGEARTVGLRGVADRIDLSVDGTFHLVDYKLGQPPSRRYALQLPVYAVQVRQALEGHLGRSWSIGDASYLSLARRDAGTSLRAHPDGLEHAVREGQARALAAVDGIESGSFPPRPAEAFLCASCPYASVCRKEHGGDDNPAPSV